MCHIYLAEGSVKCLAVPKIVISIGDLMVVILFVMRNLLYQEAILQKNNCYVMQE